MLKNASSAMTNSRTVYGLRGYSRYLHHEARMRQHVLPDIRTQMRHNLEGAARIPKVTVLTQPFYPRKGLGCRWFVRPYTKASRLPWLLMARYGAYTGWRNLDQFFQLDGERSMVGHADIKEIARDVMGDAGKALYVKIVWVRRGSEGRYHFDKFQDMTEKLRDEMKPMDHDLKVDSMANLWLMPVCDDDEISDTADVGNFLCSFLIVLASLDVCTRHWKGGDGWSTKEIMKHGEFSSPKYLGKERKLRAC